MATPQKPWKAEYAKSGRSSCKTCKNVITKETFRLGKMVQATQFDGLMPMWHHAGCIWKKPKQIKSIDDVEGIDGLRWEDQQKVREYVESTVQQKSNSIKDMVHGIEVSQNARATCKHCAKKITKGEVRISSKPDGQGSKGLAWHHASCLMELSPSIRVDNLPGWDALSPSDQSGVNDIAKKLYSKQGVGADIEGQEVKGAICESTSKAGTKRRNDASTDPKSKVAKAEGDDSDLKSRIEAQTKEFWTLKDDLKMHVTTAELRIMLETNAQDSTGSELDLRDRCADGMMFGPLASCPVCSGGIRYSGGLYRCHGYVSEWSKCSYSTKIPIRRREKWQIPEGTDNQYLKKWFKAQKGDKPARLVPTSSSNSESQIIASQHQSANSENLGELRVAITGYPKESIVKWKSKVKEFGCVLHAKVKKDSSCLVVIGALDEQDAEIKKAKRMKVPIVGENYLVDCVERKKKLPIAMYKVEVASEPSNVATIKVKGRSAVHEASGLQDSGHILEEGKSIFNTTLNLSDLTCGVNSYYIIQIIQEDKGSDCCVYRKWGRVGNDHIGGDKLEWMPKADAIAQFKRIFFEKTGNPWEAWERRDLQKQPGKFYPLEIDYGIKEQAKKENRKDVDSKLAPPLLELMKMLFNVETYRAAMMEFQINMSEMPLGKLSKSNIQKGFEALTDIQSLLSNKDPDNAVRDSLLVDASNRFFTVIPSIHPHVIRDEEILKSKVKMLESLQDIEIASKLVGFDVNGDDSIDDKYAKLHCHIAPLSHDSEDYRLIEKFLHTTHAPTHTDWSLELEEVFALEREGEYDKYAPYREKLGNKMLLWHGSRLTNFVGILSQGLRIAPPEAPATGYMFGKGVYFADLVSKSAQYCFTDKKNPVGLMLLSEVALGNIYELKNAKYMDKPPEGKHSTKGLGKKVPEESEFVTWKGDVIVPCGKPVPSKVRTSELMYNEFIVYNTSQVKMQFLLKVKFHHKR